MFTKTNVTQETKGLLDTCQSQGRNRLIKKYQGPLRSRKREIQFIRGLFHISPEHLLSYFSILTKVEQKVSGSYDTSRFEDFNE